MSIAPPQLRKKYFIRMRFLSICSETVKHVFAMMFEYNLICFEVICFVRVLPVFQLKYIVIRNPLLTEPLAHSFKCFPFSSSMTVPVADRSRGLSRACGW